MQSNGVSKENASFLVPSTADAIQWEASPPKGKAMLITRNGSTKEVLVRYDLTIIKVVQIGH